MSEVNGRPRTAPCLIAAPPHPLPLSRKGRGELGTRPPAGIFCGRSKEIFSQVLETAGDDYDDTLESEVAKDLLREQLPARPRRTCSRRPRSCGCRRWAFHRGICDSNWTARTSVKRRPAGRSNCNPGPITGRIVYRRDLFASSQPPEIPTVAVILDREVRMFHPNVALQEGYVCVHLPAGVVSLESPPAGPDRDFRVLRVPLLVALESGGGRVVCNPRGRGLARPAAHGTLVLTSLCRGGVAMKNLVGRLLDRGGKSSKPDLDGKLGVEMFDAYTGRLAAGGMDVRLRVEHEDLVHLAIPVDESARAGRGDGAKPRASGQSPLRAGSSGHVAAGRHTSRRRRAPRRHLPRIQGRTGPCPRPGDRRRTRQPPRSAAKAQIEAAIARLNWDEDRLAKRDEGWEFRVRTRGEVQAVGRRSQPASRSPFLRSDPGRGAGNREVLAGAALQLNAELRLARYAPAGDELVAEARLHAGILGPQWLAATARAVAVAARHARRLRLLAECPHVREWYERIFPRLATIARIDPVKSMFCVSFLKGGFLW